ncbi:DUF1501 domain-containing protein [Pararhodobacter oceanensis]|uniref:DUF1501 domain-containing protein n=1 Tax=Pararhodobacter oceanensis TaxID=2172121 RepID=UPI003A8D214C
MLNRRIFLQLSGAGVIAALHRSGTAFAQTQGEKRFVFIFLRGGLDGLHALPPFVDAAYRRLRPTLALAGDQVVGLDGYFGLNAALSGLMPLYQAGELALIPAAATRYRERSHFDGQNMLENGSGRPFGARDGWLNRAILGLNGGDRRLGLALGPSVPLLMQGVAGIRTFAVSPLPEVDDDFLFRMGQLYQNDPLFAQAFSAAQAAVQPATALTMMDRPLAQRDFAISAQVAAELLAAPEGPRIAAMEMQGWDTHHMQQGRLNALLAELAQGIVDLRHGLGAAWGDTVVMVASEFGRTAAENGSRGTDHGTGGLVMLAGGAVAGGQILGDWPGLSARALYESRDVAPLNTCESLFKAVLTQHLGLAESFVEDGVFPDSRGTAPIEGVIRS